MTQHTILFNTIDPILKEAVSVIEAAKKIPRFSSAPLDHFHDVCCQIPEYIRDGCLKVAVVGVIKSGKSTFVNSLVGKELVQRGAGVVTSITTRIRKGRKNQAWVYFKSWDQINAQIQDALMLFPANDNGSQSGRLDAEGFDIRRENDRKFLKRVYRRLVRDFSVTQDHIRPETLMIQHALNGFDDCREMVQADENAVCFSGNHFDAHKRYTSDSDRAFFVKDVCLEVYGKSIDAQVEIADCQGTDSTDPAQLSQVLNYLESANLTVYCISSRTGLRQSDILLLKRIQQLGRLDNIFFIINCDLSEHDSLEDLIKVESDIREHLEFLEIQPRIFSFSVLYHLFGSKGMKLTQKDQARLAMWQAEKELVDFCDTNTAAFEQAFGRAIESDQHRLLVSNHLQRLAIIMSHLDQHAGLVLDLLSSDHTREAGARQKLERLRQNATRLETIVAGSVDRAVDGLVADVRSALDDVFERDRLDLLRGARKCVETLAVDIDSYRSASADSGFNTVLYLIFQDVQRALNGYGLEQVALQIKPFIRKQEAGIVSCFQSLSDAYRIDLTAPALEEFLTHQKMSDSKGVPIDEMAPVDIEKIKKLLDLKVPEGMFRATYSTRVRLTAFSDFGVHTLVQIFRALSKRQSQVSFSPGLDRAARKIKKESIRSLAAQFNQYRSTLEQAYLIPLIQAAARDFKDKIEQRFEMYRRYEKEIEALMASRNTAEEEHQKSVTDLQLRARTLIAEISKISEEQNLPPVRKGLIN